MDSVLKVRLNLSKGRKRKKMVFEQNCDHDEIFIKHAFVILNKTQFTCVETVKFINATLMLKLCFHRERLIRTEFVPKSNIITGSTYCQNPKSKINYKSKGKPN